MLPFLHGVQHRRVPPERFPITYDTVPALVRRVLALRPDNAVVVVGDGMLTVRFGRFRLCTPLTNVVEVGAGPPRTSPSVLGVRLSPDGRGILLGTGGSGPPVGPVRLRFRRPVSAAGPAVVLRASWVTIDAVRPDDLARTLIATATVDVRPTQGTRSR